MGMFHQDLFPKKCMTDTQNESLILGKSVYLSKRGLPRFCSVDNRWRSKHRPFLTRTAEKERRSLGRQPFPVVV